tara:strand:- start:1710 stop:2612 length:903 start_codon:yes stop_codon:yes gene_type:complete
MATGNLYKKQGDFLTPASDTVPTLSPYDVNTPQAAREGLPLRMFDPTRSRYKHGEVVDADTKQYNQALNIYHLMVREGKKPSEIKTRIGENMYNKITMNKQNIRQKAATGGIMPTDPLLDPRFSRYYEQPEYRAYQEGGPVEEEAPMEIPELKEDVNMQVESMMTPSEVEGEEPEMEVEANIDTSVLTSDEEQVLEAAVEQYPQLIDIISKMTMKEFTGEGEVDGPGTGTSDSIPAMLSDGEFVFTAKAVKQLGVDKLRNMMAKAESDYDNGMGIQEQNQMMNEPMMAKGGLMSASHYKK